MEKPIEINEALQALTNLFNFCEEIDVHLPDDEKTGYQMLPDYLLVNQYIKDNEQKHGRWVKMTGMMPPEHMGKHCCSECSALAPNDFGHERLTGWCPACGAKMDD